MAESLRLTLQEAVDKALQVNLDLRATAQDVAVASAGLRRSSARLPNNPFLSVGASRRAQTGGRPNYFAFLSQEIEIGGQRQPRMLAASHNLLQEQANLKQKELSLAVDVKSTFVRALVQRERTSLLTEQLDLANRIAQAAAPRNPTLAERIERNQARLQVTRYQRELWATEREYESQVEALRHFINLDGSIALELVGNVDPDAAEELPELSALLETAYKQRADLQAFEHALAVAEAQLEVVRRERIPNITVSGSYSRFENSDFGGGDVGFPLPVFHTKEADLQEATAQRVRLSAQLEDLRRQIEREVREAWRNYGIAQREVELFQSTLLPLAEENVRLQESLVRRDEASRVDLLDQRLDFLEIRKDYLETLQSLHLARLDLERAVGGELPKRQVPAASPTPR